MKYQIIWSAFAEKQLDDIVYYYENTVKNRQIGLKIITKLILSTEKLRLNPSLGQQETALLNRKIFYRYIVESNYKIIYSVDDETRQIKIADVFDTRQNPKKIEREK